MALIDDLREALLQFVFAPAGAPIPFAITQQTANAAEPVEGWELITSGWSELTVAGAAQPSLVRHDTIRALHAAAIGDVLDDANSVDFGGVRVGRTIGYLALVGFAAPGQHAGAVQPLTRRAVVTDSTLTGSGVTGSPLGVSQGTPLPPGRLEVSSMDEVAAQIQLLGEQLPAHGDDYEYAERLLTTVRQMFARRMIPEALGWEEVSLGAAMTVARLWARRDSPLGVATPDGVMKVMQDMDIAKLLDGAWRFTF